MSKFQMNTQARRSVTFFCTECEGQPVTLRIETVEDVANDRKGLRLQSDCGSEMSLRCPKGHEQKVIFTSNCDVSV